LAEFADACGDEFAALGDDARRAVRAIGVAQRDGEVRRVHDDDVGDGLVAQIPSLVLSTATAIIVTRVSAAKDMGEQVAEQLFSSPRAWFTVAAVVGLLGIVPGMPTLMFLLLGAAFGAAGWM